MGLNVAYNCVDRHVDKRARLAHRDHLRTGERRAETITYEQLQQRVSQAANTLDRPGVAAGDRVAIYVPMIPQAVVAMLACARIGRPLGDLRRLLSRGPATASTTRRRMVVITSDGQFRRGSSCRSNRPWTAVEHPSVGRCWWSGAPATRCSGTRRDLWWHDVVSDGQ